MLVSMFHASSYGDEPTSRISQIRIYCGNNSLHYTFRTGHFICSYEKADKTKPCICEIYKGTELISYAHSTPGWCDERAQAVLEGKAFSIGRNQTVRDHAGMTCTIDESMSFVFES